MAEDRYRGTRLSERVSRAIVSSENEASLVDGIDSAYKTQRLLNDLRSLMASPFFDPSITDKWAKLERELAAGRGMSLAFIEVKRLAMALEDAEHGHPELIGPIQRMKKREPSGRTKAWRAGIANFHDMQAKRPLKPPGR